MKKILILISIFPLLFAANICFAEIDSTSTNHSGWDSSLEDELNSIGINTSMLTGDMSNFRDGDFRLTDKIIRAIMSDKLLKNNLEARTNLQQEINKNATLVFPWSNSGLVKLVNENGKLWAELRQDNGENTSLSQGIIFKNSNASLKFDLEIIKVNSNDVLEILIDNLLTTADEPELVVASYKLSNLSGTNQFVVDLSRNRQFTAALAELKNKPKQDQPMVDVVFRLTGSKNKAEPTIIRLGNLQIAY